MLATHSANLHKPGQTNYTSSNHIQIVTEFRDLFAALTFNNEHNASAINSKNFYKVLLPVIMLKFTKYREMHFRRIFLVAVFT